MPNPLMGKIFDEFPEESEWDVVVIGGGPNGLIASAYLARAGLKVVTVERRYETGGGLATEEILFPGYYSNMHSVYHLMVDYMPVLRDFDLGRHALQWTKPNAQAGILFEDRSSLLLTHMAEDTKDSITKVSFRDAVRFGKLMRRWGKIVDEILAPATYIPPMSPLDITMAMQKTRLGEEMLELVEQAPLDILRESFESEQLRTLLLYVGCMWGLDPRETGLGMFVPLMLERGRNKCYCVGGSHKFAGALAREIVSHGGTILDAAEVTKILIEHGRAAGVEIAEGRRLRSKVVMSTLDPHTTFLRLVGEESLPAPLGESVRGWEYDKWSYYTLHVATREPPQYSCDDHWINGAFMNIIGAESVDLLLAHWDNVVAGRIDLDQFAGHATCESFFDPHLVHSPYGGHVSFFQMHAPYDIEGGWEKRAPEIEQAILEKWERAAPNMTKDNILMTGYETPVGIEIRLPNMKRGGIKHGDYRPLQMGCFRPNQECSSSATPIEGLYTCGASNYPGGMILGAPGYLGAGKVAEDLGITRWWRPTPAMERYTRTYLD